MKYIFVAGAPGSKWSSVVKNIYYSPSLDNTDYSDARTYYHDAQDIGTPELMHLGAYYDPGMEFDLPEYLTDLTKDQAEALFDKAFSGNGIRLVKSHIFSYKENIDYLRKHWPECPIVLVHRNDDSCLGWWVKCGHFNITYPLYQEYYHNLVDMARIIKRQNAGIVQAFDTMKPFRVYTNARLALVLGIELPPQEYRQNYVNSDIDVRVIV
jgi:hypothetical protein